MLDIAVQELLFSKGTVLRLKQLANMLLIFIAFFVSKLGIICKELHPLNMLETEVAIPVSNLEMDLIEKQLLNILFSVSPLEVLNNGKLSRA